MNRYCFVVFMVCMSFSAVSQTEHARTHHFNLKNKIALNGFDPVSYFSHKPREGSEEFAFTFRGITYLFASAANLDKFKSSPEKFEPAYGGWCAYAMGATGEKVKIDPETFKVVNGKLYLFYNFWGNNTLDDWNESEAKLKHDADLNWSKIVK